VAAVDLAGGSPHALRHEALQLGMDGPVLVGWAFVGWRNTDASPQLDASVVIQNLKDG
jgi:hypothetical protein